MSIAKAPFIIGMILGSYVTYTPPTSAALPQEKERINHKEGLLRPSRLAPYIKGLYLVLGIVEVILVVADNARWLPGSSHILELLMGGKTEHFYLTNISALGASLATFGGLIRFSCYRAMGRHFTFDLSIRDSHKLITEGPYGVVRHPSYSGTLLNTIGVLCFHAAQGSWLRESAILPLWLGRVLIGIMIALAFGPLGFIRKRMELEDKALRGEFMEAWDVWAREVRFWLVPGVY